MRKFSILSSVLLVILAFSTFSVIGKQSTMMGDNEEKKSVITKASEEKPYGGHLRIASTWPVPSDLNPYIDFQAFSPAGALPIWSSFFRSDENGTLQPDLAVNYTTTNGVDFVINLVENATWHDGTLFTSDDAIFTLEMLMNRTDPNLDPWWDYDWDYVIDSMERLSDHSLMIHLNKTEILKWFPTATDPGFPGLYLDRLPIIAKHVYSSGLQRDGPIVGTGPWKLSSWHAHKNMTLTVNTDYFKGRPYLNNLTYRWDIPKDEFASNILNNSIDLAYIAWGHFDPEQVSAVSDVPGVSHESIIGDTLEFICMNLTNSDLANLTIRQGITRTVDKQKICDVARGGYALPAISYVCPGWKDWYDPNVPQYSYDPQEAQKLLNNTDLNLRLIVPAYDPHRFNASMIVAKNLMEAGVNLTVIESPSIDYTLSAVYSGDFDLAIFGIKIGHVDPDYWAHALWHPDWWWARFWGFSNSTIDSMLEQARVSIDKSEKQKIHNWIQGNISYLVPMVFLYWHENSVIQNNDFHGLPRSSCLNILDPISLEKIYYDPTLSGQGKSPVKVCFTDSEERKTGFFNGSVLNEIPNSLYDEESNAVKIRSPSEGVYEVEVIGTGKGTYSLELVNVALEYKHVDIQGATIRENQTRRYYITILPDGSMEVINTVPDLNGNNHVFLYDAVIVGAAYGSTPDSPNWNAQADIAAPIDKVDLYDAVTIGANYGKSWD